MVKLQKHKAYTYKSKEDGKVVDHFKHTIIVPENLVQTLGWNDGIELQATVEKGSLVVRPEYQSKRASAK